MKQPNDAVGKTGEQEGKRGAAYEEGKVEGELRRVEGNTIERKVVHVVGKKCNKSR